MVPTGVKMELMSADETGAFEKEAPPDKDMMCPICIQVIRDAFLTACGHSFCHSCIVTHLGIKSDCPCCGQYLTPNLIFPNFLLDKVRRETLIGLLHCLVECELVMWMLIFSTVLLQLLRKSSAYMIERTGSPLEHLRRRLHEVSNG